MPPDADFSSSTSIAPARRGCAQIEQHTSVGEDDASARPSINQNAKLAIDRFETVSGRASTPFQLPICLRLRGPVNEVALERAIDWIVARHETLRTRFQAVEAVSTDPMAALAAHFRSLEGWRVPMVTAHAVPAACVRLDVRSPRASGPSISGCVRQLLREPVDASRAPLLRATLVNTPTHRRILIVVLSHLAADGWSQGLFVRELQVAYRAFVERGVAPAVAPLARNYVDYVRWQRERLEQPAVLAGLVMRQQEHVRCLANELSVADLGMACRDHFDGARLTVSRASLGDELSNALRAYCRSKQVTPYVVVLAALLWLGRRQAPGRHVAVWVRYANRLMPDSEHVIGWFSEERLLGIELETSPTPSDVIEATRAAVFGGAADQFLPAAAVQHPLWMAGGRRTPANVLRVSLDELQGGRRGIALARNLVADRLFVPNASFRSPFRIYLENGPTCAISCVYPCSAVPREAAVGMLRHLRVAIADLVAANGNRFSS